jgi:hypothetical protein
MNRKEIGYSLKYPVSFLFYHVFSGVDATSGLLCSSQDSFAMLAKNEVEAM